MKRMKALSGLLALALLTACGTQGATPTPDPTQTPDSAGAEGGEVRVIHLSASENADGTWSHFATLDGEAVAEYDYTWNVDPSAAHDEVKNAPAEYFTGTKPAGEETVYIAHDICYYPELPQEDFQLTNYDGDREWAYYYTAEGCEDYIFATLPAGMGDMGGDPSGDGETDFTLSEPVNNFSGVMDYDPEAAPSAL